MNGKTVISVAIAALIGGLIGWTVKPTGGDDDAPERLGGNGPPCHAAVSNCVMIELVPESGVVPETVQAPRGSRGQPPIESETTTSTPPEVDLDEVEELRFHAADAGNHQDDQELGPTGCHYWVEHNGTWYKLHC